MPYVSTHKQGGHLELHVIECSICGCWTSPQPSAHHAWSDAKASGWVTPASTPLAPKCPTCASGLGFPT